ncbi:ABC transporter permease [Microbacterium saperdae]
MDAGGLRVAGRILGWVGRRLGGIVAVMWAAATMSFLALKLLPGDPVDALLGPNVGATPALRETIRADLGLDQPLPAQYGAFLLRLATFDLGRSYRLGRFVGDLLTEQLPSTLALAAGAVVVAAVIAIGLAILAGISRPARRWPLGLAALVGSSAPSFWVGLVLLSVFAFQLRWLPGTSTGDIAGLVLPSITLGLPLGCVLGQIMIRSIEEAEVQPFWVTARARGESRTRAVLVHGLRHAAIPALTLGGWTAAGLIGGAVLIETVFARPGIGRTLVDAITTRDIPVITGVVVLSALAFALTTTLLDALSRVVDPRLRSAR